MENLAGLVNKAYGKVKEACNDYTIDTITLQQPFEYRSTEKSVTITADYNQKSQHLQAVKLKLYDPFADTPLNKTEVVGLSKHIQKPSELNFRAQENTDPGKNFNLDFSNCKLFILGTFYSLLDEEHELIKEVSKTFDWNFKKSDTKAFYKINYEKAAAAFESASVYEFSPQIFLKGKGNRSLFITSTNYPETKTITNTIKISGSNGRFRSKRKPFPENRLSEIEKTIETYRHTALYETPFYVSKANLISKKDGSYDFYLAEPDDKNLMQINMW